VRADPAPTYARRYSGPASVTCTPAFPPVSGTPHPSWSISSCRTGPALRGSLQPTATEYLMSGTSSFGAFHPREVRMTCGVPAWKTARTGAATQCDLAH
jgi:hypothetical protein